jgi:hypothetical protein
VPLSRFSSFLAREFPLLGLLALYAFLLARLTPNELVQDSWLALVSGREVAEHGLPTHDSLTALAHGLSWTDQQWLAQLTLYGVFLLGGVTGFLTVNVLLLAGTLAIAMAAARRGGASQLSVLLLGTAFVFVAPWSWQLRTQTVAYPLFAGLLWLLASESRTPSKRVYLAFPILVLWANLHGTAALGAGLVVLHGLSFALQQLRRREPRAKWMARSVALVVAPALCLFASPYGLGLVGYYRRMLGDSTLARFVNEWGPTTLSQAWVFFALCFAAIWLLARHGRCVTRFEQWTLFALLALGLGSLRGVVWFGLACVLILPRALDEARPRMRRTFAGRGHAILGGAAVTAVVAAIVSVGLTSPAKHLRRWPEPAVQAVARVTDEDPSVRIFASARYADWLLWKQPELAGRVAYDVRFELFSEAELERLQSFHRRTGSSWMSFANGYRLVVLDRRRDSELEAPFSREPGARILYRDAEVAVILRAGSREEVTGSVTAS